MTDLSRYCIGPVAKDFQLCGFNTFIDLWPFIEVVKNYEIKGKPLYHPMGFTKVLDRIEAQIDRLKWCQEVCFAHQAWAKFDFETTDPNTLQKRIYLTQQKLERIAARYPARSK